MPTAADTPFSADVASVDLVSTFWGGVPYLTQIRYVLGLAPFMVYVGGIRAGKTWSGVLKEYLLCQMYPNVNGLIAGRTATKDVAQTLLPQFMAHDRTLTAALGYSPIRKFHKGDQIAEFWNGSLLYFRAYMNPDALRGITLGHGFLDEIDYARNPRAVWDVAAGRMSKAPHCLHGATTPNGMGGIVGKFHQEVTEWRESAPQGRGPLEYIAYHAKTSDNPHLTRRFVDTLRRGYSPRKARQELDGEILRPLNVYFPEYDERTHLVPWRWDDKYPWILSVDWGPNNAAATAIQVLPDGTWIVADECLMSDGGGFITFRHMLAAFVGKRRNPPALMVGDRAVKSENNWMRGAFGEASDVQTCRTRDEQDLTRGSEMLRFMLAPMVEGAPRLLLSSELRRSPGDVEGALHIRDAFHSYQAKRDRDGRLTNKPNDAPDDPAKHVLDTVRMAIVITAHDDRYHGGRELPFVTSEQWSGRKAA